MADRTLPPLTREIVRDADGRMIGIRDLEPDTTELSEHELEAIVASNMRTAAYQAAQQAGQAAFNEGFRRGVQEGVRHGAEHGAQAGWQQATATANAGWLQVVKDAVTQTVEQMDQRALADQKRATRTAYEAGYRAGWRDLQSLAKQRRQPRRRRALNR